MIRNEIRLWKVAIVILLLQWCFVRWIYSFAEDTKQGIVVNGDTVEYNTDKQQVLASGNVQVNYKGSKLSCDKLTVNTGTKGGIAQGNLTLVDPRGTITGDSIEYNFDTKTGSIHNATFTSLPFYGRAALLQKINDSEYHAAEGYLTTCNYEHPHFRMQSKDIRFFPGEKAETKGNVLYLNDIPILYLPRYTHEFNQKSMHVQVMPGTRKDWGGFILSAWRYEFNDYLKGLLYLDYRQKLGPAEGFSTNFILPNMGKGDFKFYYTDETPTKKLAPSALVGAGAETPTDFTRYFTRLRYRWDVDPRTSVTSEYLKIGDERRKTYDPGAAFLKDYFFREYESDSQPMSYVTLHHGFDYSSLDVTLQKRTNFWFNQIERLPEALYSLPNMRLGTTPFYFEHTTTAGNYDLTGPVGTVNQDINSARLDTYNKASLPMRAGFVAITPFVANRETAYDRSADGQGLPVRSIFYTGADMSTKFYRVMNVRSNFLGLDVNGLRHIITPSIGYRYNHSPTIGSWRLKQIDGIDDIGVNNSILLELSNKLQTKRKGNSVDLLNLRVASEYVNYAQDSLDGGRSHDMFRDTLIDLEFLPYSWLRLNSQSHFSSDLGYFNDANYDVGFMLGKDRTLDFGQRYLRKGSNSITSGLTWRFNPKWKMNIYNRYEIGHDPSLKRGFQEMEYSLERDLHCWIAEMTVRHDRYGGGTTIYFAFKLKAFPEMQFGFDQSYHSPHPGSQSN